MSELHTFDLGDLSIEVEEFKDFYDGTLWRDYYITISSEGFDMYQASLVHHKLDSKAHLDIALRHTVTKEEEFGERADYEHDRENDR